LIGRAGNYGSDTDDQLGNGNHDGIAVLDELSILPAIVAIEGHAVRLLWSIMAGRLLHVLASAPVTGFGCRPAREARGMRQGRGPAFESRQ